MESTLLKYWNSQAQLENDKLERLAADQRWAFEASRAAQKDLQERKNAEALAKSVKSFNPNRGTSIGTPELSKKINDQYEIFNKKAEEEINKYGLNDRMKILEGKMSKGEQLTDSEKRDYAAIQSSIGEIYDKYLPSYEQNSKIQAQFERIPQTKEEALKDFINTYTANGGRDLQKAYQMAELQTKDLLSEKDILNQYNERAKSYNDAIIKRAEQALEIDKFNANAINTARKANAAGSTSSSSSKKGGTSGKSVEEIYAKGYTNLFDKVVEGGEYDALLWADDGDLVRKKLRDMQEADVPPDIAASILSKYGKNGSMLAADKGVSSPEDFSGDVEVAIAKAKNGDYKNYYNPTSTKKMKESYRAVTLNPSRYKASTVSGAELYMNDKKRQTNQAWSEIQNILGLNKTDETSQPVIRSTKVEKSSKIKKSTKNPKVTKTPTKEEILRREEEIIKKSNEESAKETKDLLKSREYRRLKNKTKRIIDSNFDGAILKIANSGWSGEYDPKDFTKKEKYNLLRKGNLEGVDKRVLKLIVDGVEKDPYRDEQDILLSLYAQTELGRLDKIKNTKQGNSKQNESKKVQPSISRDILNSYYKMSDQKFEKLPKNEIIKILQQKRIPKDLELKARQALLRKGV